MAGQIWIADDFDAALTGDICLGSLRLSVMRTRYEDLVSAASRLRAAEGTSIIGCTMPDLLALVLWRSFLKCCEQLFRAVGRGHSILEDNVLSWYVLTV